MYQSNLEHLVSKWDGESDDDDDYYEETGGFMGAKFEDVNTTVASSASKVSSADTKATKSG